MKRAEQVPWTIEALRNELNADTATLENLRTQILAELEAKTKALLQQSRQADDAEIEKLIEDWKCQLSQTSEPSQAPQ